MCAHRYVLLFSWFNEMEKKITTAVGDYGNIMSSQKKLLHVLYKKKCLGSGTLIKGKRKVLCDSEI